MPDPNKLWQVLFGKGSSPEQAAAKAKYLAGMALSAPRDAAAFWASAADPGRMLGRPESASPEAKTASANQLPLIGDAARLGDRLMADTQDAINPVDALAIAQMAPGFMRTVGGRIGRPTVQVRTRPPRGGNLTRTPQPIVPRDPTMKELGHATAAEFEKFDPKFFKTGEGAMVYGPGFYTAENPNVTRQYKKNLLADGRLKAHVKAIRIPKADADNFLRLDDGADALSPVAHKALRETIEELAPNAGLIKRPSDYRHQGATPRVVLAAGEQGAIDPFLDVSTVLSEVKLHLRDKLAKERIAQAGRQVWPREAYEIELQAGQDAEHQIAQALAKRGVGGKFYMDQNSRNGPIGGEATFNYLLFGEYAKEKAQIVDPKTAKVRPRAPLEDDLLLEPLTSE